ncbi:hypothetical protein E2P71_04995 [Candidatus Bathyarchaeota archaeon]|nr:hypothetical protein E2P71_04995 [Candidatus Bathyarchaeota archaeon]
MDLISSIIELYFSIMELINVRSVSIVIIVLIIGIEFLEFFTDKNEVEEDDVADRKPRKRKDNAYFRKLFGLESGKGSVRSGLDKSGPSAASHPESASTGSDPAQGYLANYDEGLSSGEDKVQVIGSKTYTVRTVLEGNYIYLEEVEGKATG